MIAVAQSARDNCRPVQVIPLASDASEPAPKIVINPPLAEPLASRGELIIEYCAENLDIVPSRRQFRHSGRPFFLWVVLLSLGGTSFPVPGSAWPCSKQVGSRSRSRSGRGYEKCIIVLVISQESPDLFGCVVHPPYRPDTNGSGLCC
jgi:hypothetical protein